MVAAHVLKPKIENGDLMGANGGPKTEEGPHGDLGLQMRTHLGAVLTEDLNQFFLAFFGLLLNISLLILNFSNLNGIFI